jgi:RNA polymerase sigma-70 factor (ECF subfamily)
MDEKDLIERAAAGEREPFEALVERKRERVFWIAYHLVGDRELARDVAQEVFLRLFRVMRRFRRGGRFDAWLYRMTVHLAIDAFRRERPHRRTVPLETGAGATAAVGWDASDRRSSRGTLLGGEVTTGESLRQLEVRRIFVELSQLLSRKQRQAFVLREVEGMSTEEVATVMKTRPSTVRNHILQARRILQRELRRRYPEYCRRGGREP